MSEVMEDWAKEIIAKEKENNILRAISLKKRSLAEIAEMFEVPLAKVSELGKLHKLI